MNRDANLEAELRQLLLPSPSTVPPAMRAAVLDRVTAELSRQRQRRVTRRWALGAVGLVLFGVGANLAVMHYEESRLQTLCGPVPVSRPTRELLQAVAEVTDKQTAASLQEQLLAMRVRPRSEGDEFMRLYTAQLQKAADASRWTQAE